MSVFFACQGLTAGAGKSSIPRESKEADMAENAKDETAKKKPLSGYEVKATLFIPADPNDHDSVAAASKKVGMLKKLYFAELAELKDGPEIVVDDITSRYISRRSTEK
jgi:hypothetical protein